MSYIDRSLRFYSPANTFRKRVHLPRSPLHTLEQKTKFPAQTIRDALQKLITEGFVAEEEGIYFLAKD